MRIRTIKPEFWSSEDIAALDWPTRLLFIGLWSYVDDNGVGRDSTKLIRAALFPLEDDPRDCLATVSRGLQKLSESGLVTRYTVDGRDYLWITSWDRHQRIDKPNKDRYPLVTSENAVIRDTLATPSRESRDTLAPGTGEQGNRGTGEKTTSSSEVADATTDQDDEPREEVQALCARLADGIEANGSRRPTVTRKWHDAARLLIDKDEFSIEQVEWIIDWSQRDEFWKSNILSMPKLREKFDQLKLRAVGTGSANGTSAVDPDWALR